ncbi:MULTISPECIES: HetZ-related protein 2 [Okeania]|uniref:HetZ-related protein 2 n=1 Tax=Okeania hirsuta TaxID=1458930 RepID=A0A3N6QBA0_9CYAN|nr:MULTISPECIES: HetZ-related protein 2 [Okeania]NET13011.1 HetZ-related protein 2 [Okeania sp. SIO1H6]NEP72293.1 HetZ-related protein 2 [Okeania sp. SIO2G5]NEP89978.1 HetZ-related protein 2 [Okeania sp. SIO2C2]NEP94260.1 HetZ-related protein 2 [Okeania sp. SIO2F5]NEQ90973.1 HetZ-related protein 2 [Okeania sp. SIO2G4]
MTLAQALEQEWKTKLQEDYPNHSSDVHKSIICWLLGNNPSRLDELTPTQRAMASKGREFLYRILKQRYLDIPPERAYRNLLQRLSGLVMLRQKIRAWVNTSRDRQRSVIDVLQEVIQEMLNSDRYLQQQMAKISECTKNPNLRNSLLLASVEEYCIRPIRNQPLLVYRFVNYLRRTQRGGLTQVPVKEWVKLISEDISPGDTEDRVSLLDAVVTSGYQDTEEMEQQHLLRSKVQEEFEKYLVEKVDSKAAEWLKLYLRGNTQEEIAQALDMPIRQVYRLREKVSYHAIRVFAVKQQPELVASWLEISLNEHGLGLTSHQWQEYWQNLNPQQRHLIEGLKSGTSLEEIAKHLNLRINQVVSEWTKLYLSAQSLRNSS